MAQIAARIKLREVSHLPNIKSAEKRVELSKAQNAANKAKRSALRTSLKKFDAAVAAGDKEAASACYADAVKKVDKAAGQNLIHKNNAARKKSSLTKALNGMN